MKKGIALLLALAMVFALVLPAAAAETGPAIEATAEAENIKKYGNVVLSMTCEALFDAGYVYGDMLSVSFLDRTLALPLCSNYSDVDSGAPAIFVRTGETWVEAAINMGDFATTYGIAVKTTLEDNSFRWDYAEGVEGPVVFRLSLQEPGGYYEEYVMRQLSYSDERSDYPGLTDAQFANFREVTTSGMGDGILYRTASPVNPEHRRNTYADAAIRSAGVTVVMNLADDAQTVMGYEGYADSYYASTEYIALNMGVDFAAEDFQAKLAEGLRFFALHPGVYAVHCTEGKDRAGFVAALLECLMGADYDEILSDYMVTYYNYYGVTADDARYDVIVNSNIVKSLQRAFGTEELGTADLSACAEAYMKRIGLTDAEITELRTNLSSDGKETPLPFTDIADGAWYEDAVRYVYEAGLMTGTGDFAFSPGMELNRAQMVTILWRCAGEPTVNGGANFADVSPDAWYAGAVRWATKEQIVARVGNFGPDDILTREETVALMWNYAKYAGADVSVGEDTNILSYDDVFDISEGFAAAMQWAVGSGLITGTDTSHLSPQGRLTRAQAAAILMRLPGALRAGQPLGLWTESARARTELIGYMAAITDENSPDYIPVEDRIAVFDLDGTLFCETDPNYFDYTLLKYRVLEDPDYKDKASDFEKEVANKIKEQNETGKSFSGLEVDHGKAVASAFAGMTIAEFNEYIQEFKKQAMPSYDGMLRGDGWYLPMLQIVDYLKANDFTVYIVSGTDRLIVRGIVYNSPLGLPNRQIIGSDELIVSTGQGDTDGLNYVFKDGDELILGGEFLIKNLKMNKVSVIMQEIGQQPVLSFGNSTGDSSMAEYVTYNNPYRSLAFMLCCDDTERENGSDSKAQKMFELCEEFDWVPVSMKNDWTTIYGDGVTYTGAYPAGEAAA